MNNTVKNMVKVFIISISDKALTVMNAILLPLSAAFIYACVGFCRTAYIDYIFAKSYYAPIFEHLMISLIILICGGALLDISLRELGDK